MGYINSLGTNWGMRSKGAGGSSVQVTAGASGIYQMNKEGGQGERIGRRGRLSKIKTTQAANAKT